MLLHVLVLLRDLEIAFGKLMRSCRHVVLEQVVQEICCGIDATFLQLHGARDHRLLMLWLRWLHHLVDEAAS